MNGELREIHSAIVSRLFAFNASYQFTPVLNLRPTIFGLTLFGGFISIYVSISFLFPYGNIIFDLRPFYLRPTFFIKQNYGVTKGPCCT
jgi:hypothetical protein